VRIIVGLGNPGREYRYARHNAGWMALDALVRRSDAGREDFRTGGVAVRAGDLLLFRPLRYMNRSGQPVADILRAEQVPLAHVLVMLDDVNLPLGVVRLRARGSSGGHNGLASVIEALGTDEFPRLRMGIGPCPFDRVLRDFVLSPFEDDEWDAVDDMVDRAAEAAVCWVRQGITAAMDEFNRKDAGGPGTEDRRADRAERRRDEATGSP